MRKLCLGLAACLLLGGCTWELVAADPAEQAPAHDGWIVQVSVEPADVGPITISLSPTRNLRPNDSRAWIEHDLVFENTGDRPVTFADTRTGARLSSRGHSRLLAADQGCGYALFESRFELVCAAYLDIPTVEPHRTLTRTVTLWKGLRPMEPLTAGTYLFRKEVRFKVGRKPPAEGGGRTTTVRIVYQVDAA